MAVVAIVFLLKTAKVEVCVITIVTESVLVEVFLIKAAVAPLVSCYELMQALLSPTGSFVDGAPSISSEQTSIII